MTADESVTRAEFIVRKKGLYARTDGGQWSRVAKSLAMITVAFRNGQIRITNAAVSKRRGEGDLFVEGRRGRNGASNGLAVDATNQESRIAAMAIRHKLAQSDGMLDLTTHRFLLAKLSRYMFDSAAGFKIGIPGIGAALVIKPETLSSWIPSNISVRQSVKQLDAEGYLIRGCDRKLTRQVKIQWLGRRRYYCFKTDTAKAKINRKICRPFRRLSMGCLLIQPF